MAAFYPPGPSSGFTNPMTTAGDIIYGGTSGAATRLPAATNGQVLTLSSGLPAWENSTGGGGGSKNYLSVITTSNGTNTGNGDFESGNTTGWSLGNSSLTSNFPSGTPTFGSGSSSNLSLSVISSGQLEALYSGSYVSSAATTAGNFLASDAFYIDLEDQSKILNFSFAYKADSGSSNCNFSGTTSNSFGVAVYDVTNSAWIQPNGYLGMTQGSGVGICIGSFQTTSNSTQYRLIVYNANATSGAATIYFDSFQVSPQVSVIGSVVTDWQSFTPTIVGFGTATNISVFSRRVGGNLEVHGQFQAGTTTATTATMTLGFAGGNSNVTVDSTVLPNSTVVGALTVGQASTTFFGGYIIAPSSSVSYVNIGLQTSTANALSDASGNGVSSSAYVTFHFSVPILGWSSNVQLSPPVGAPVVAFSALPQLPTGTISSSPNVVKFGTVANDTLGKYNTSTGLYTFGVTGWYQAAGMLELQGASATLGNAVYAKILLNGSSPIATSDIQVSNTSILNYTVNVSAAAFHANAGDTVGMYSQSAMPTTTFQNTYTGSAFSISMIPSMAATYNPVIAARYTNSSAQSLANGTYTTITNWTKDVDLSDIVNASTGVATISIPGFYTINAHLEYAANSVGGRGLALITTGSNPRTIYIAQQPSAAASTDTDIINGSDSIYLISGDTVAIQGFQRSGGSLSLGSNCGFSIIKD